MTYAYLLIREVHFTVYSAFAHFKEPFPDYGNPPERIGLEL